MISDVDHLDDIVSHLAEVHKNAVKIAKALLQNGETDLAQNLLQRAYSHDVDKFKGIQWTCMRMGEPKTNQIELAILEHNHTNAHHPEYHGNIHKMSKLDVAEMLCDWGARAAEFKTSLQDYIDKTAMKRYGFTKTDAVYALIMSFKRMLCDEPFEGVEQ